MIQTARNRCDERGYEIEGRLEGLGDLVAEEAWYHISCKRAFERVSTNSVSSVILRGSSKNITFNFY